ncbi:MAG: hypothetical protein IH934_04730 [Nanoarchaeota archaeon]|nr:hypothetical protein [Nanoarchaeota archaeon]
MNPLKIFEYDPLDRSKLNWFTRIVAWLIEYIARILGAIYLSIALLLVSIWPKRSASKTFFRLIGTVADMYRAKWMSEEQSKEEVKDNAGNNGSESMDKGNDGKVCSMESCK